MTELATFETPNTAPAVQTNTALSLVGWAGEMRAAYEIASTICQTMFAPAHFRGKAEEAAAAILYGYTLEMPPMVSLKSIYVVHGTPALYAQQMYAIALSKGHDIERVSATEQTVEFRCKRRGSQTWQKVVWTIERARQAGYTSNAKYRENPIGMLTEKCKAEAAKLVAPDALAGMSSVEEMQLEGSSELPVEAAPAPESKPERTVQRKTPVAPAPALPSAVQDAPQDEEDAETATGEILEPSATPTQIRKITGLLKDVNVTERERIREVLSEFVGRTLASSRELTKAEASRFIKEAEATKGPAQGEESGELHDDAAWLNGEGDQP